jgi:cyclophilin family peptidyl-prolyl cis-trans isomerase
MMTPAKYLDGEYVIFGEVLSGLRVAHKINALAKGRPGGVAGAEAEVRIEESGQLRAGKIMTIN